MIKPTEYEKLNSAIGEISKSNQTLARALDETNKAIALTNKAVADSNKELRELIAETRSEIISTLSEKIDTKVSEEIEGLAIMVQHGFADSNARTNARFDRVEIRLEDVDNRLDSIETGLATNKHVRYNNDLF